MRGQAPGGAHGRRWVVGTVAAVAGMALAAPAANAQYPVGIEPDTVTVIGTGTAPVTPKDRRSETSIRAALATAQRRAIPLALADAQRSAFVIGQRSGLTLGAIGAVNQQQFFGPQVYPRYNGNFCGRTRSRRTVVDDEGRRRVVRGRLRRVCQVPGSVTVTLQVSYRIVPAA